MKTIAAFFDVDGTLFTGHVWRGMLKYFQGARGVWPVRWFWYTHLAWLARGWDRSQLNGMYRWIADMYLPPYRREDTIGFLAEHNRQGHLTVLVSTGFTKPALQYTSNCHSVYLASA